MGWQLGMTLSCLSLPVLSGCQDSDWFSASGSVAAFLPTCRELLTAFELAPTTCTVIGDNGLKEVK